jgi:hypothetical protein
MDWINVRSDEEVYRRPGDPPTPPLSQDSDKEPGIMDGGKQQVEPGPHNEPGTAPKYQTNKHPHGQPEVPVTPDTNAMDEQTQVQTPPHVQSTTTTTAGTEEADRQAAVAILLRRKLNTDAESGMGTPEIVPITSAQVDGQGQLTGKSSLEQLRSLSQGVDGDTKKKTYVIASDDAELRDILTRSLERVGTTSYIWRIGDPWTELCPRNTRRDIRPERGMRRSSEAWFSRASFPHSTDRMRARRTVRFTDFTSCSGSPFSCSSSRLVLVPERPGPWKTSR